MPKNEREDLGPYLRPGWFIDSDSPRVVEYAAEAVGEATDERERAVRLFYRVRDGIRYNPYAFLLEREQFKASAIADATSAFCIPKSILLAAAGRVMGIPTRLGFADVRNHLSSPDLRARMGTDLFIYHGWTEFHLGGKWVKATAAFNLGLCERFGVKPLEFDGRKDCIYQPYDLQGRRHMEYVNLRGTYADYPYDEVMTAFRENYGGHGTGKPDQPPDDPAFG